MKRHNIIIYMFIVSVQTILWLISTPLPGYCQDVVVIANNDIPQDTIDKKDIEKIFLGRKTRWENGASIHFVTMKSGPVHERFLKKYVNKTPSQFSLFWKKMVFSGKGGFPKRFDTPEQIVDYVVNTPGSVGYVPASAIGKTDKVKVIRVMG